MSCEREEFSSLLSCIVDLQLNIPVAHCRGQLRGRCKTLKETIVGEDYGGGRKKEEESSKNLCSLRNPLEFLCGPTKGKSGDLLFNLPAELASELLKSCARASKLSAYLEAIYIIIVLNFCSLIDN